ncbi:hypothetical protein M3Y94_00207200 [Aphelenchoides besseyi]|nr:hypothetical protein M3Y94_00207200 [Aphelenchoides besseyi]
MVFSRIQLLKAHKKNIHSKANKCKFCSTRFPTQENLSEHLISSHMYIRVYYCNLCAQHVPTRADLAYHKARVHEKKSNLVRRMDFDNETEDEGLTDEDIVSDSENEEHKPPSKFSNPPKFMTPLALIPRSKFNWQHSNQKVSYTKKKKKRLGKQKRNSNVFFLNIK